MSTGQASQRRPYRSQRRQQQAADTRNVVLDAALLMFSDRGWAGTSMRDVARAAGVAVETVYSGFGSKSDLLMAAIDVGVVGDEESKALAEREEFQALGRGRPPARARAAASLVLDVHRRNAGLVLALREAALSDDGAARRWNEGQRRRHEDVQRAATLVAGRTPTAAECDGLWAITDVEVYRMLTDLRGWTPEQYEDWLADVIERLLPPRARKG
jgi:AcrR family transcriptional regulator